MQTNVTRVGLKIVSLETVIRARAKGTRPLCVCAMNHMKMTKSTDYQPPLDVS